MARKRRPDAEGRLVRGRARTEARFPAAPSQAALPEDYAAALAAIKSRIKEERLRVVLSAHAALSPARPVAEQGSRDPVIPGDNYPDAGGT